MPLQEQFPGFCLGPAIAGLIGLAIWMAALAIKEGRELFRLLRAQAEVPGGLVRWVLRLLAFGLLALLLLGAAYVALG
ncbi:MAG: hypothetical protein JXA37_12435 [Chloroflexia bacterium]|nr:hypothetical protein [Chloroflexia bacterium]